MKNATVIFVEGPRGVGKTAAIAAAVSKLRKAGKSAKAVKFDRGESPWEDMSKSLTELRNSLATEPAIIFVDRFHLTETVMRISEEPEYEQQFTLNRLHKLALVIELTISNDGWQTIVLTANAKLLETRVAKRNDGRGSENDNVLDCWFAEMMAMVTDGQFITTVNVSGMTPDEEADALLGAIK